MSIIWGFAKSGIMSHQQNFNKFRLDSNAKASLSFKICFTNISKTSRLTNDGKANLDYKTYFIKLTEFRASRVSIYRRT